MTQIRQHEHIPENIVAQTDASKLKRLRSLINPPLDGSSAYVCLEGISPAVIYCVLSKITFGCLYISGRI